MPNFGKRLLDINALTKPAAIIHHGVFADANLAFLELLGFATVDDLHTFTFLDLVPSNRRDRARRLLLESMSTERALTDETWEWVTIARPDGSTFRAFARAQKCRFNGEDCIQIHLKKSALYSYPRRVMTSLWFQRLAAVIAVTFAFSPVLFLEDVTFSNSSNSFISEKADAVSATSSFPKRNTLRLVFESAALFSNSFLLALDGMATHVQNIPGIEKVVSLTTSKRIRMWNGKLEAVPAMSPSALSSLHWTKRRDQIISNDFLPPSIVNSDGSSLAVVIVPERNIKYTELFPLYRKIISDLKDFGIAKNLISVDGSWASAVVDTQAIRKDFSGRLLMAIGSGLLLVWWAYRSLLTLTVTGVAIGFVIDANLAVHVLLAQPYTPASALALTVILVIVLFMLIILFSPDDAVSRRDLPRKKSKTGIVSETRQPAFYASVLVLASVSAVTVSTLTPFRFSALLIIGSLLLTYGLIFLILRRLDNRVGGFQSPRKTPAMRSVDRIVRKLNEGALRSPRASIGIALALLVGFVLIIKIAPANVSLGRTADGAMSEPISFDITLQSVGQDGFLSQDAIQTITNLRDWLEDHSEIEYTRSFVDFIEDMNWAFHEEIPVFRRIPESTQDIRSLLSLYDGNDLWEYVNRSFKEIRLEVYAHLTNADSLDKVVPAVRRKLEMLEMPGISWNLSGFQVDDMYLHETLSKDLPLVLGASLLLTSGALGALWRSFNTVILSILPTLFSLVSVQVASTFFKIQVDISTVWTAIIVAAFSLGRTAFLLSSVIYPVRNSGNLARVIARSYRYAGCAMTLASLAACLILLLSAMSELSALLSFGLLTTFGLMSGWVADMLVLPAALYLKGPQKRFAL